MPWASKAAKVEYVKKIVRIPVSPGGAMPPYSDLPHAVTLPWASSAAKALPVEKIVRIPVSGGAVPPYPPPRRELALGVQRGKGGIRGEDRANSRQILGRRAASPGSPPRRDRALGVQSGKGTIRGEDRADSREPWGCRAAPAAEPSDVT